MNAGYVLIVATLVLGCAIATAGDRLGSKVGKSRLRLFNLRPRETATLVTTISGGLVAASTLGILLAIDSSLRTGLFELEEIQADLETARDDLEATAQEKQQVKTELDDSRRAQITAQRRLNQLDRDLDNAATELDRAESELQTAEDDLNEALTQQALTDEQLAETEALLARADELRAESEQEIARIEAELSEIEIRQASLQGEIGTLQAERRQLLDATEVVKAQLADRDAQLSERDTQLADRDTQLADRDAQLQDNQARLDAQTRELAEREVLLAGLREQQVESEAKLQELRQNIQRFRERRIAIEQGQVLASGLLQVIDPNGVDDAILALLQQANATAAQQLGVEVDELPIVNVSRDVLQSLRDRLSDRREYVVRVLSTGNYLLGETGVQVFVEAVPNVLIFATDEAISRTTLQPRRMEPEDIVQQLYWVVEAARFRAQRNGVLVSQARLGDGRPETLVEFVTALVDLSGEVEVQAVASRDTFAASPLVLELVAIQDGVVVARTQASVGAAAEDSEESY